MLSTRRLSPSTLRLVYMCVCMHILSHTRTLARSQTHTHHMQRERERKTERESERETRIHAQTFSFTHTNTHSLSHTHTHARAHTHTHYIHCCIYVPDDIVCNIHNMFAHICANTHLQRERAREKEHSSTRPIAPFKHVVRVSVCA